jgi:hypothetical protein
MEPTVEKVAEWPVLNIGCQDMDERNRGIQFLEGSHVLNLIEVGSIGPMIWTDYFTDGGPVLRIQKAEENISDEEVHDEMQQLLISMTYDPEEEEEMYKPNDESSY